MTQVHVDLLSRSQLIMIILTGRQHELSLLLVVPACNLKYIHVCKLNEYILKQALEVQNPMGNVSPDLA